MALQASINRHTRLNTQIWLLNMKENEKRWVPVVLSIHYVNPVKTNNTTEFLIESTMVLKVNVQVEVQLFHIRFICL
jgi:hypothetical protein